MGLAKVLHILSGMLGSVGGACVTLSCSMIAVAIWMGAHEQTTSLAAMDAHRATAEAADTPAVDRRDAGALYETYGAAAASTCDAASEDYIRNVAKDDFEWSSSASDLFGARFNKYQEIVSQPGVITLSTDKLILRSKSKTDTRVAFYCRYNTLTHKVLGYEVGP